MNKSVDTRIGMTGRYCPSSTSHFALPRVTGLSAGVVRAPPDPYSGPLPALLPVSGEKRPRGRVDSYLQQRHASVSPRSARRTPPICSGSDFQTSESGRPRFTAGSPMDVSFPTTLPPPCPTLPPLSIPMQPQANPFASSKPLLTLLPPLPPLTKNPRRRSSSQLDSCHPSNNRNSSRNSSESPIGGRYYTHVPSRRNSSLDNFLNQPLTSHSRRSSQASTHHSVASSEDSGMNASASATTANVEAAVLRLAPRKVSLSSPASSSPASQAPAKSRRVRTGCLTCRERHLKCDESLPDCLNCRKGGRACKRGLRLNFIDIQMRPIPRIPPVTEWKVSFLDESREIASEYVGGSSRYPRIDKEKPRTLEKLGRPGKLVSRISVDGATESPTTKRRRLSAVIAAATATSVSGQLLSKVGPSETTMNTNSPVALTRERIQLLPVAGIGINEDGMFGLVSDKETGNMRRRISRASDVSSIASSMAHHSTDVASSSFRAEAGNGPEIPGHVDALLPDTLPTPPSEKDGIADGNDEVFAVTGFDAFGQDKNRSSQNQKDYLCSPDEMLYMQVFVEEVGIWMDSLDKHKHFTCVVPFLALRSPMLLNALFACGAKHLALVNEAYNDDRALFYYDTATSQLMRSLQNPERNVVECATAATVLNVYEVMGEKRKRTNHIVGARALIRECNWSARSKGIGSACFWLSIGMEVLSSLANNWPLSWDPEDWGLDLSFVDMLTGTKKMKSTMTGWEAAISKQKERSKSEGEEHIRNSTVPTNEDDDEEVWVRRMFYIVAKVSNFHANVSELEQQSIQNGQTRPRDRTDEWGHLKALCDGWNHHCPRSMKPFGYLHTSSSSTFPNIWLIKRSAVIGRLFYHTAMILLYQTDPASPSDSDENKSAQLHHARQVCGIVAHTKDRGIVSVAIRSLVISALILRDSREQDEISSLFHKIELETGWRIGKLLRDILHVWRHGSALGFQSEMMIHGPQSSLNCGSSHLLPLPNIPSTNADYRRLERGAYLPHFYRRSTASDEFSYTSGDFNMSLSLNPPHALLPTQPAKNPLIGADFSLPNRPYKAFYQPPNRTNLFNARIF